MKKTNIKFVNHASILINSEVKILSDPWYFGSSFNDGWDLIHETSEIEILEIINKIDFIYISHEHPDHFSIGFFLKYKNILLKKNIKILFQETLDKKLIIFLRRNLFKFIELKNHQWQELSKTNRVLIGKNGYLDSYLIFDDGKNIILNTNDCELSETEIIKLKKILPLNRKKFLFHQFSFAVWRPDNQWAKKTAQSKFEKLILLNKILETDFIFPFASFIFFKHKYNFYLNKYALTPKLVSTLLSKKGIKHSFFIPNKTFLILDDVNYAKLKIINSKSIEYWDRKYSQIRCQRYKIAKIDNINEINFSLFFDRIKKNNNLFLLFLLRIISFKFLFGDIFLKIDGFKYIVKINFYKYSIVQGRFYDVRLPYNSFKDMISNPWGVDTISINGLFHEGYPGGFTKLLRSIGFSALNSHNLGINFSFFLNLKIFQRSFFYLLRTIKNDK